MRSMDSYSNSMEGFTIEESVFEARLAKLDEVRNLATERRLRWVKPRRKDPQDQTTTHNRRLGKTAQVRPRQSTIRTC